MPTEPTDVHDAAFEAELTDALRAYGEAVAGDVAARDLDDLRSRRTPRRRSNPPAGIVTAVAAVLAVLVLAAGVLNTGGDARVDVRPAKFSPTPPYPDVMAPRVEKLPKRHTADVAYLVDQGRVRGERWRLLAWPNQAQPFTCFAYDGLFDRGERCTSGETLVSRPTLPVRLLTEPDHGWSFVGFARDDVRAVAMIDAAGTRRVVPAVRIPGAAVRVFVFTSPTLPAPVIDRIDALDMDGNVIREPDRDR